MMTYEEAKAHQKKLEEKNTADSEALRAFDKYGKTEMGLTPDHVKAMPEWRKAKQDFNISFSELRTYNSWFVKTFKKERAMERRNRYKQKTV